MVPFRFEMLLPVSSSPLASLLKKPAVSASCNPHSCVSWGSDLFLSPPLSSSTRLALFYALLPKTPVPWSLQWQLRSHEMLYRWHNNGIFSLVVAQMVKHLPAMQETEFNRWVRKIPWRRKWQPTAIHLPGKFHGWRSLVGYSPWGRKELDTTEGLHFHFSRRSDWEQNIQSIFPEGRWVKGFGKTCSLGSPSTNLQEWVTCSSWDGPVWAAVPPTFPHPRRLDPTARKQGVLSTLQGLVNPRNWIRLNPQSIFFFPLRIVTNFQRSLFWTELIQGAL